MADLQLALKGEYFDQIARGEKLEEYRLCTSYWANRLEFRTFDQIILTRGYPKGGGVEGVTRLTCRYQGWRKTILEHPHFGEQPVVVYAIDVSARLSSPQNDRRGCGV